MYVEGKIAEDWKFTSHHCLRRPSSTSIITIRRSHSNHNLKGPQCLIDKADLKRIKQGNFFLNDLIRNLALGDRRTPGRMLTLIFIGLTPHHRIQLGRRRSRSLFICYTYYNTYAFGYWNQTFGYVVFPDDGDHSGKLLASKDARKL